MPSKYVRKGPAPRSVSPLIELTPEFKEQNYTETIRRMYNNGVCSKESADQMLARVVALVGKDTE